MLAVVKAGHHPGAFRLYLDPAAYRLPVLYAAAVRPGRRSALHDAVCLGLYFLHLLSWDSLAEELEDPFGTAANDLPLNAMCNTIERNLLDMTGQHPLPETLRPDRYFNLT